MATTKDLSQLEHILAPSVLHFYYEQQADGTKVLHHIRVGRHTFDVPTDGVTMDTIPENSVGSQQIDNGSIQMEDLSPEVRENMNTPGSRVELTENENPMTLINT